MLLNRKFDHINVGVPNIEEAIKYYTEVLGFKFVDKCDSSLKFAFLTDGNLTYELIEREGIEVSTFDHIAYVSDDIEKDFAHFDALGVTTMPISIMPKLFGNGVKFFFIKGVNGERIEFCQKI